MSRATAPSASVRGLQDCWHARVSPPPSRLAGGCGGPAEDLPGGAGAPLAAVAREQQCRRRRRCLPLEAQQAWSRGHCLRWSTLPLRRGAGGPTATATAAWRRHVGDRWMGGLAGLVERRPRVGPSTGPCCAQIQVTAVVRRRSVLLVLAQRRGECVCVEHGHWNSHGTVGFCPGDQGSPRVALTRPDQTRERSEGPCVREPPRGGLRRNVEGRISRPRVFHARGGEAKGPVAGHAAAQSRWRRFVCPVRGSPASRDPIVR